MSIKRYDPTPGGTDGFVEKMNEAADGGWISHTDHVTALEAEKAENKRLHKALMNARVAIEWNGDVEVLVADEAEATVRYIKAEAALEANQQVIETLKAEHRAQMADMSERFREVNVTEALRQMGNDQQVIETLRAALEEVKFASLYGDWTVKYRADQSARLALDKLAAHTQPEPTRGQSDAEL